MDLAEVRSGSGVSASSFPDELAYGYAGGITALRQVASCACAGGSGRAGDRPRAARPWCLGDRQGDRHLGTMKTRKGRRARHQHDGGARAAGAQAANDADLSGGRKKLEG